MNIISVTCRDFRVPVSARAVLLIIMAALCLGALSGAAIAEPVWENGEYHIYTSADLKVMADWVNDSTVSRDAKYRLMEDIDLDGMDVPWLPIGAITNVFGGEFNGGGHTIHNFVISRDANYIGLFGVISGDARISDLKAISFDVRGNWFVGGLVGVNGNGIISVSSANGTVSGDNGVGGLVGGNYIGTISTSYTNVAVNGGLNVGGLVGHNEGTIITSYASGAVNGKISYIGGLVGMNYNGTISISYASGAVSGNLEVGGLAGENSGTISTSYASGAVIGSIDIGGLAGWNLNGTISTSYASGLVSGDQQIGGLVGYNYNGTINTSYWLQDAVKNINTGLSGVGRDNNAISTDVTSLNLAGMANRASFNTVSWKFHGDSGVTSPDWCYTSFDNGAAPALFAFVTVTVNPIISITTQPISTTVTQGSISGSLSVTASVTEGVALTYQWYSSTTNNNTGGNAISGATNASFAIPTGLQIGTYYYYCVVSAPGAASVTSNAVSVTVTTDDGGEDTGCNAGFELFALVILGISGFILRKRQ